MPLEYSEEKLRDIDSELQLSALLSTSKERIDYLEKERKYFLTKINKLK